MGGGGGGSRTFFSSKSISNDININMQSLCLPPLGSVDIMFFPEAIFMKLYTNINQHEMTCRVQEW